MGALNQGNGQLRAQSISIQVSGRTKCMAGCKFCVSRLTPNGEGQVLKKLDRNRLKVGLRFAERLGATHAILTGKADPLQEDDGYMGNLIELAANHLPLVDMHTNGIRLLPGRSYDKVFYKWIKMGLTQATLSLAHHDLDKNTELMGIFEDTKQVIPILRKAGLMVRCSVVLAKRGICCFPDLLDYIRTVGELGAQAVVVRQLWCPRDHIKKTRRLWIGTKVT